MAQVRKQFSRSLYEAYDGPARTALVLFLENNGHTIVNNEENYSVDVVSQKGGHTYFNEAEVKTGWKSDWPMEKPYKDEDLEQLGKEYNPPLSLKEMKSPKTKVK